MEAFFELESFFFQVSTTYRLSPVTNLSLLFRETCEPFGRFSSLGAIRQRALTKRSKAPQQPRPRRLSLLDFFLVFFFGISCSFFLLFCSVLCRSLDFGFPCSFFFVKHFTKERKRERKRILPPYKNLGGAGRQRQRDWEDM